MNLLYGQIVEIASEDGMRVGKIRVAGAFKTVSLELLGEPQIGDRVLVCDGIALNKEEPVELLFEQLSSTMPGHYSKPPVLQHSNPPPGGLQAFNEVPERARSKDLLKQIDVSSNPR